MVEREVPDLHLPQIGESSETQFLAVEEAARVSERGFGSSNSAKEKSGQTRGICYGKAAEVGKGSESDAYFAKFRNIADRNGLVLRHYRS